MGKSIHKKLRHLGAFAAAGATGAAAAAYAWHYCALCKAPELVFQDSPLSRLVLARCPALVQAYCPTFWATNAHVQTLLCVLRGKLMSPGYARQKLTTPDGGTIALDWFRGCDEPGALPITAPVLLVLHGLTGGSREGYCKLICAAAAAKGWRAVVLNYRGCAGLPMTSPRCYSAAFTDDVHQAVCEVRQRFPGAPIVAAAYSLGAVILTKYLAEADTGHWPGEGSGIAGAALVSNPLCLHASSAALSRPWTLPYLYNLGLALRLRQYLREHSSALASHVQVDPGTEAWTISHFDETVVCRLFGYEDVHEYYHDSSSQNYIPFVRTPALFLVSADDPFLGRLPRAECAANPHTLLAVTPRGGHVAFLEGAWPFGRAWMDTAVTQFLDACLQGASELRPERGGSIAGEAPGLARM
ncbi:hypothetical protein WJX81_004527 [Elliptochloris bilobata]|uniref:AB hydrolase-1 domain-containing protein n=1 Tax=Elliptochloris bilobata TaxID=381761 RepID=A0AAW1SCS5_9CHLO